MDTVTTFITALMVTMSTQSIHHKVAEGEEVLVESSSFVASFAVASAFAFAQENVRGKMEVSTTVSTTKVSMKKLLLKRLSSNITMNSLSHIHHLHSLLFRWDNHKCTLLEWLHQCILLDNNLCILQDNNQCIPLVVILHRVSL
jgi:hypothetical protein